MEFYEKLQQLRKQNHLTQEQLAQQLFVSRTAVSKWESGRGYPNLESLKCISQLFSVSIDELLSNDTLIELAETENRFNLNKMSGLVFGVLDTASIAFLFMPLFGQQEGEHIRAVTLLAHTSMNDLLRTLYIASLSVLSLFGVLELTFVLMSNESGLRMHKPCSIALYTAEILLFALSRQPYMTVFLFLQFVIKAILTIQETRFK